MPLVNLERKIKSPPRRQSGGSTMDGFTGSRLKLFGVWIEPGKKLNLLNTNINSLPDEIVFDILVRIPAKDIYCAVRLVCLKWYQMIRTREFVNAHLHRSTHGLLIQNIGSPRIQLTFVELSRQGRIELTRLNYKPEYSLWCSSCNGLILESEHNNVALCITNPVTMQHFSLPPTPPPCFGMEFFYSALAYASLSMKYKVVRVYRYEEQWCCAILTAGVDGSWRSVCTQHLSREAKALLMSQPLATEGFVHWATMDGYVLTLNVETEIITVYPIPSLRSCDGQCYSRYYFSTEKYLSMLVACRPYQEWSWEVWEMEPETGDWTKLPGIELEDRKGEILGWISECDIIFKSGCYSNRCCWLIPVGWLNYKEVLVYRVRCLYTWEEPSFCIAWNIRLKEFQFIHTDSIHTGFFVHRNSLV